MGARLRTRGQRELGKRPKTLKTRELVAEVRSQAEPLFDWAQKRQGWGNHAIPARPTTRGECESCPTCQAHVDSGEVADSNRLECGHRAGEAVNRCRPCLRISCRYHLAIDVKEGGYLRLNFPDRGLDEMPETCALDVADRHHGNGISRERVGDLINLTGQRVSSIEAAARRALKAQLGVEDDDESEDE